MKNVLNRRAFLGAFTGILATFRPDVQGIRIRYQTVWAGHADVEYETGSLETFDRWGLTLIVRGKRTWIRWDQIAFR